MARGTIEERLASLEGWRFDVSREVRELERAQKAFQRRYGPLVDSMAKADEIAAAVAARTHETSQLRLSWAARLGGFVVGAVAVADFIVAITRSH